MGEKDEKPYGRKDGKQREGQDGNNKRVKRGIKSGGKDDKQREGNDGKEKK